MFRFSLSTMLICVFVAAVVLSYCMNIPAKAHASWLFDIKGAVLYGPDVEWYSSNGTPLRSPTRTEILLRLAWFEPLTLALTLFAIQGVRKIWRSIPRGKHPSHESIG